MRCFVGRVRRMIRGTPPPLRRRLWRLPPAVALSLLIGCATVPSPGPGTPVASVSAPTPTRTEELELAGVAIRIEHAASDTAVVAQLESALRAALPRLRRWGEFEAPVTIRVHPDHAALERAVRRIDYPWLRAWARYDSIELQSPATWSLMGARSGQVEELIAHELTHCLMFQRMARRSDWMRQRVPFWFREGMASVTSEQGYRRPNPPQLADYLARNPDVDPVNEGDALQQRENDVAYGAAHRAFEYLLARHGDEAVLSLMAATRAGASFDEAFTRATGGLGPKLFAQAFLEQVRLRAPWPVDNQSPISPATPANNPAAAAPR